MADVRMTMVGSYQSIIKALASGKVKPDTYVYVKDMEMLAWVDLDTVLHLLGDSVQQIQNFPANGNRHVLYIKGTTPYIYDGTEYVPLNNDFYLRLEAVEEQLKGLVNPETGEVVPVVDYVEEQLEPVQEKVNTVSDIVENIQKNGAAIMITSDDVNGGEN